MAKSKIERMIEDQGYPDDVAHAVMDHAVQLGTVEDIERGVKSLPHPEDAQRWFDDRIAEEDRKRGEELRKKASAGSVPAAS